MPKFAANLTMMFNEVPFPQRFQAAAAAGFKGVEFLFPYDHQPEELAGLLKQHQLENVTFNLPPGDWAAGERGLGALPGREEEFRAGVQRGIDYARAMGTRRVHLMAGVVADGADRAMHTDVFLGHLRYAAREVAQHGLTLLIEPINGRDMPGYFLRTQAQGHALREQCGEPNVKVQMDFYHAQIVEGDLTTTFKRFFDGIGHVQVASVPARHEPCDGEVNYPYLFKLLDELGYPGWVGCEYRPRAGTVDGLGWLATASK